MWQLMAGAVMISFSAVFVKLVSIPPTVSAFYRMLFGGTILLAIVLWRRESLRFRPAAWGVMAAAAFFFALDLVFWHRSILYVGPGVATLLANFQVFVVAAIGVFMFKERLTPVQMLAIALAMTGLALLVGSDWTRLPPLYHRGVALGLLTACSYAGYILSLRNSRAGGGSGSSFATITVVSLVTALFLALTLLVGGESFAIPTWNDAGWLLAYGIFGQVLGWVLISTSIAKLGAAQVGIVLLMQPACAMLWDGLFFGRRFTAVELAGAVLALFAIYMGSLRQRPAWLRRSS